MDKVFSDFGQVIVDDVCDVLNVNAAGGQIRGYQNPESSLLESGQRGVPLRQALIEAGRIRLRPILMTSFALIAGMLPVAIGAGEGADFNAPLGRAVIGGVIASTILTLLVIPTVYEIVDGFRTAMMRGFGKIFTTAEIKPKPAVEA